MFTGGTIWILTHGIRAGASFEPAIRGMVAAGRARSRCDVNDYFILYFEGHATVLSDPDDQALSAVCTLLGLGVEELCGQMIWGMHRYRWTWGNFNSAGDRRFWSMFLFTRVPCWVPIFDPQPDGAFN